MTNSQTRPYQVDRRDVFRLMRDEFPNDFFTVDDGMRLWTEKHKEYGGENAEPANRNYMLNIFRNLTRTDKMFIRRARGIYAVRRNHAPDLQKEKANDPSVPKVRTYAKT